MTHDELLAKIDWIGKTKDAESGTATPLGVAVLASLNALRAVVELHKPISFPSTTGLPPECTVCKAPPYHSSNEIYPCPTIQAIEKELNNG